MPEKKRYKRPASGVRHARRSASAEMIDREDDDVRDGENVSPARRRPRRKKTHGEQIVGAVIVPVIKNKPLVNL